MSASSMATVFPLCSSVQGDYTGVLGIPGWIQMGKLSEKLPTPSTRIPAVRLPLALHKMSLGGLTQMRV